MKKVLLFALFAIWSTHLALASRQFDCYLAPIESKIGLGAFTKALQNDLNSRLDSDSTIKLVEKPIEDGLLKVHAVFRKELRFPEKEALFITITRPNDQIAYFTLLYQPEDRQSQQSALIKQLNETLIRQLKAESIPNLDRNLSNDMNHNIYHIQLNSTQLQVELIGKQTEQKHKWEEKVQTTRETSIPIAKKKQPKEDKVLLDFMDRPTPSERDPTKYEPEPPKPATASLDPFASDNKANTPDYLVKYPRLQNGGLAALIITPQLNELENKNDERFSFSTSSSVTFESFNNTIGTSTYKFDGRFLQQRIALSAKLWSRINLGVETALGQRDSDVQFDALHPSAAGGTTFLPAQSLGTGITDTVMTLSWKSPLEKFSLRPVLKLKIPTGSESDLLGSGHVDYSAGVMANVPFKVWTWGVALHLIVPGDIGNFDPAQGDLPATSSVSFQTGFARTLDYYGPLNVSFAYHYMQNPLRELSSMPETEEDIHNLGVLLERQIRKSEWTFQTQASTGLSPSAANASISFGFDYSH